MWGRRALRLPVSRGGWSTRPCVWTTCSFSLDGRALARGEVCRAGLVKHVGAAGKSRHWYGEPESRPRVLGVVLGVGWESVQGKRDSRPPSYGGILPCCAQCFELVRGWGGDPPHGVDPLLLGLPCKEVLTPSLRAEPTMGLRGIHLGHQCQACIPGPAHLRLEH